MSKTLRRTEVATTTGPVEYLIVEFPGNRFTGQIIPELGKLVESGTIRILDLAFVSKNTEGEVLVFELEDYEDVDLLTLLENEPGGLVSDEDLDYAAADLEPGSSAALLIWEDCWASPFVTALRESGGVLVESARIPQELLAAAEAETAAH